MDMSNPANQDAFKRELIELLKRYGMHARCLCVFSTSVDADYIIGRGPEPADYLNMLHSAREFVAQNTVARLVRDIIKGSENDC